MPPAPAPQATVVFGDKWLGAFSAVLTLAILIVSEIIPKTIGALHWKRLAGVVVASLRGIILVLWPLVVAMEAVTKLLSRGKPKTGMSRRELNALHELGATEGIVKEEELQILRNLFRFGSLTAKDIMTPRTVLFTLPQTLTVGEALAAHETIRFSRLPIYGASVDDITGYVLKDHLLLEAAHDRTAQSLTELRREMHIIPATARLPKVFETMVNRRDHISLVVDEYGGTAGVLTMEDIVETLLGMEIVDELDSVEDLQAHARRVWRDRAQQMGLVTDNSEGDDSSDDSVS